MRRACRWTRMPGQLAQPAPGATRCGHWLHLIGRRAGPRSDPASRAPALHPRASDRDQTPPPTSVTSPAAAPDHDDLRQLKTEPRVCPARPRRAGDPPAVAGGTVIFILTDPRGPSGVVSLSVIGLGHGSRAHRRRSAWGRGPVRIKARVTPDLGILRASRGASDPRWRVSCGWAVLVGCSPRGGGVG